MVKSGMTNEDQSPEIETIQYIIITDSNTCYC